MSRIKKLLVGFPWAGFWFGMWLETQLDIVDWVRGLI